MSPLGDRADLGVGQLRMERADDAHPENDPQPVGVDDVAVDVQRHRQCRRQIPARPSSGRRASSSSDAALSSGRRTSRPRRRSRFERRGKRKRLSRMLDRTYLPAVGERLLPRGRREPNQVSLDLPIHRVLGERSDPSLPTGKCCALTRSMHHDSHRHQRSHALSAITINSKMTAPRSAAGPPQFTYSTTSGQIATKAPR